MKILIAEDNYEDRKLLRYFLEKRNNEVIDAADGQEGLDKASVYIPDLIISDTLMPRMDGFEFLRNLKKDPELRSIPFIFYSAVYTGDQEQDLALSLGARAYIVKPKDPDEFWEALDAALESEAPAEEYVPADLVAEDEEFLQRYPQIVTDKLEEMVNELREEIVRRNQAEHALEIINRKLNLLTGITRHDILNQITAILGYADLLGAVLPDDVEMRKYIDRITKATSVIQEEIRFAADYEEFGMQPSLWQRVADIAERAVSGCADRGVNVSIATGALEIFTDPMLEKVFHNLFENAVRHGGYVTEISVTCREEDGGGSVVIAVEDNGVGVPADMKERIFKRGVGSNTGYGLYLIQEILGITGMSIRETGVEGKGACLEIIVPPGVWRTSHFAEV